MSHLSSVHWQLKAVVNNMNKILETKMKTWNNTDKSAWPNTGEWNDEPDKAHWIDEDTKLDCLIVRGPTGALCGYVGVPATHTVFEWDYDKVYDEFDVEVHGGLTFADLCQPNDDDSKGVCHPKEEAANELVWWLGFDCAHAWDVAPAYDSVGCGDSIYRNFAFVQKEVTNLAKQLKEKQ